ncbi:chloramphenicol resistance protein [Clostridium perfringens]|uniref:chloramphenicol resistance protein n=1 Tax=Clostridium perfringens TaxID=1502 RepID=UPI0039E821C5|nr:chloramphenicol resistance protein [Clostridium perfringens]EHR1332501.1 chloramphenicol resistance protein [Clostridium perfringens]EHR1426081.1 chloramphenicol resistance protein [Clostridium perfringens]
MTIIESIRNFIKKCPYLEEFEGVVRIGVDYLDKESTTYSIEKVPCNPIIKKYVDGSCKKQELFIFSSRESYGQDVFNNLENINFYEKFAEWIEEMNVKGELPLIDNRRKAEKLEVTSNGYAFQTDVDKAQYQIQLKLIYIEERK